MKKCLNHWNNVMLKLLIEYLGEEEKLLKKILKLANDLNKAFIRFDSASIERVSDKQDFVLKQLSRMEEKRIDLLMQWLKLNKEEAHNLKLSTIERNIKGPEKDQIKNLKESIGSINTQLLEINRNNKILGNRSRYSVNNIMKTLTNGKNVVLNVRV